MKALETEREPVAWGNVSPAVPPEIKVALLTGGSDRPYAFGMTMALVSKGMCVDVIGSNQVDSPEMHASPRLNFLNLHGNLREKISRVRKAGRVLRFYARLARYVLAAKPRVFHILWNNKFTYFDRTLLMLCYKLLGKKIAFTAHNVNAARRDGIDSWVNRMTLRVQYHLVDHIFVHTEKMKTELLQEFAVPGKAVTVIPFGINNSVPNTQLTVAEARLRLGIERTAKTILFFGAIWPYKGLEHLVAAFQRVAPLHPDFRLLIVGESKKGSEQYLAEIQKTIEADVSNKRVIQKIEFVPDAETEVYFKAADVLVLPYTEIFQSGVLFLAYSFGLPVIAANVGSFKDDIIPGKTGYLSRSCSAEDLGNAIETYFASELFHALDRRRQEIRDFANARNSWSVVGDKTRKVYEDLLSKKLPLTA